MVMGIEPEWANGYIQWNKTVGKHQNRLDLLEKLESLGLKLAEAIYIDPGQRYSTMGQIRLTNWVEKHRNAILALTWTRMEFMHKDKGKEVVTRKLRTTLELAGVHRAVDIYLLEGNANLVLGEEFLQEN